MSSEKETKSAPQNAAKTKESPAGRWVGYRPEIEVLDCTIRDGGLMNDHQFTDAAVKGVYDACVQGGIDYMELGYKGSKRIFVPTDFGPWKFCSEASAPRM